MTDSLPDPKSAVTRKPWISPPRAGAILGLGGLVWFFAATAVRLHEHERMMETMRTVRSAATVLEHYVAQAGICPRPGLVGSAEGVLEELEDYGPLFLTRDSWNRPLIYSCASDGKHYSILSLGSNGAVEYRGHPYYADDIGLPEAAVDIIASDGVWKSWYYGVTPESHIEPDDEFLRRLRGIRGVVSPTIE